MLHFGNTLLYHGVDMDIQELWKSVLGEIELRISRPNFLTWLKQSRLVGKDEKEGVALVGLPNNFAKEWVQSRYHKLILGSLRNLDGSIKSINYVVVSGDDLSASLMRSKRATRNASAPQPQESLIDTAVDSKTNLNPRYALNSFIVGSSNELAHAAVQAVVASVGTKYNPLFLYGGVGLGKTHLIQGAGNAIAQTYKEKVRVLYVTSERFINDVVSALRNKRTEDMKRKYRDIDVLIIDDVQFIGGKAATEQEFFYTFNALHEHNKQIIISSDRPPAAIPTLEERLRSRFEGGMIVDVGYPDYETRLAILRAQAQAQNVSIEGSILETIAERVQKNIRELTGVFNKVVFYQQYKGEQIDTGRLGDIINEVTQVSQKSISPADVITAVSDFFDVSPQDLSNRSRRKEVVEPRQVCMYIMRDLLHLSYPVIGEKLGKRDHTTAIHACDKITREVGRNPQLNQKILLIRERLQSG
jgi:chromosomal replication initiator protein